MSDTQPQSYTPTIAPARKGISLWVWALILAVAVGVLAGAVWWVGGPESALKALGINGISIPQFSLPSFGGQSPQAPSGQSVQPSAVTTASALPKEAQALMFAEQVESHTALEALVTGKISAFSFGVPTVAEASASVPVTATFSDLSRQGTIGLARYRKTWYFASFTSAKDADDTAQVATPMTFDEGVVSTITEQQALPATQEMIADGLLKGGYREATIDGIQMGERTATLDLTLSGGTESPSKGRFILVSKTDAGTTYWFVARFEKR